MINGSVALVVGLTGGIIGSAFNKRILDSIKADSFPKDPKTKYTLIAKHCGFLGKWSRYDSYNLSVFCIGMLFLAGAAVLAVMRFERSEMPFQDILQLAFLVNALSWITISSILMIGRFIQLMHIYQYGLRQEEKMHISHQSKKDVEGKKTRYWIVVAVATVIFIGGGLSLLKLPIFFLILTACYLVFMVIFNTLYRKKHQ
nr:hypothetical protein [Bacillus velezensis]